MLALVELQCPRRGLLQHPFAHPEQGLGVVARVVHDVLELGILLQKLVEELVGVDIYGDFVEFVLAPHTFILAGAVGLRIFRIGNCSRYINQAYTGFPLNAAERQSDRLRSAETGS